MIALFSFTFGVAVAAQVELRLTEIEGGQTVLDAQLLIEAPMLSQPSVLEWAREDGAIERVQLSVSEERVASEDGEALHVTFEVEIWREPPPGWFGRRRRPELIAQPTLVCPDGRVATVSMGRMGPDGAPRELLELTLIPRLEG
ncbi:MAG: hypothetical protein H6741_21305 [Alphaproteobacteria bacterium]|nr:hypothetical protein [Alphaproteobacteria bacterium]